MARKRTPKGFARTQVVANCGGCPFSHQDEHGDPEWVCTVTEDRSGMLRDLVRGRDPISWGW